VYCQCGAGFYRGIWETILERPVRVEVLESVLSGGDVCRVAVQTGLKPEKNLD
jgi:predicted hydrocarbon binding protein